MSRPWSIDLRSLAVFRIGIASVILLDLAARAFQLRAHYTDLGILPLRNVAEGSALSIGSLTAVLIPGGVVPQAIFFLVYALAATALLVGFRTRAATVVCWVCCLALLARNPLVLHRADTLVKMALFWGIFLPLGAVWSFDYRSTSQRLRRSVANPATFALLLQYCMMFWFAVFSRAPTEWWSEASAIYYASHCDVIARPLGTALRQLPTAFLVTLSRLVLVLEVLLPALLWVPIRTELARFWSMVLFLPLLLGFAFSFSIGLFPMVCAVGLLPFLPTAFWSTLRRRIPRLRASSLRPAGGDGARGYALSQPWQVTITVLLLLVVLWNVDGLTQERRMPRPLQAATRLIGIDQRWDIFAPHPPKRDRWFILVGHTESGDQIDLFRDRPVDWTKPSRFGPWFQSYRWRRYWFRLPTIPTLYDELADYLQREWERDHPAARLERVELVMLEELSPRFGTDETSPAEIDRVTVWNRSL